jgi:hypothetical protein
MSKDSPAYTYNVLLMIILHIAQKNDSGGKPPLSSSVYDFSSILF